ncbi:TolC family protein [Sinimarinibacterium sp. NLF-5-8]|uniref:TolC family protein n=1 Tax=Sinimarinibacterium sp. NLF-5-8 TaxID=2698684 RepID=UPI00137BA90B|nr:TolC family protein [Sinimarinibacterium sp. NLF-5-8]QHS10153.1 TolC family protein [Sinimarinibacterium sp. NLF-5-8]
MRFQRIVGQMPPASLAPVSDPAQAVPQALTTALSVAYAHNPGLHATFENIDAAQSAKKVAQSRYYPTLELGARHGVYQNTNGFDGRIDRDRNGEESVVELRARYNLFRGMSDRAADHAAAYRVNQSQDLRDKACVDLRQTLAIAHNDVLNVQFKLRALESHRSNAVNVITAYREQFDAGRCSLLDVLDAQNEAFQAERALINGRFDLSTAQARTLQSMGTLLDVLSARPDTLADATQDDGGARAQNYCTAFAAQDMNMQTQLTEVLQAPAPIAPAAQVVPVVTEKAFVVQGDALFDSGSATLGAQAIAALKPLLDQLQQAAQVRMIEITGHTDSSGHAARNQTLSEARAQSVKAYLIQAGVDAALIQTHGVAATQPLADNATAAGRAQNRRVEIRVQMTQP